jgi:hypothetical protein
VRFPAQINQFRGQLGAGIDLINLFTTEETG